MTMAMGNSAMAAVALPPLICLLFVASALPSCGLVVAPSPPVLHDGGGGGIEIANTLDRSASAARRAFLSTASATISLLAAPRPSRARYVLNEDTGDYDELSDEDWQTTWGKRLDKAKSMSTEDVFLAAQGAGNLESKEGEESEVSKKRRALAGCRNDGFRKRSGEKAIKSCTARVLGGDYQFMIDAM